MNIITIELCAEDRARLDRLQAAMERMAGPAIPRAAEALQAVAEAVKTAAEEEQLPEAAPEPQPEPEQPKVDRADIQKKVVALSGAGKKAEVRDIVLAYGNTKVSDIPEDKLAEVMEKLTALGG